ncbi:alpha/beta fold hydrolase [Pseudomonas putida]|uniref:alpha/beta fold hydrolase n=1 Tax=Pseudomonas putida TaxID=303 RepID=UPI0023631F94|nr:alpha/beta hydrolase [Pseudomonas putida]MDD2002086.1 alpha/beta hydrolase [Pseudomonas putida]
MNTLVANPSLVVGSGKERVILVHGWMAGHQMFSPMLSFVNQKKFSYALLDCRGYGTRKNVGGPYDMTTIAADVISLADSLGWKRFHLVGHSMAGMAAQWLMISAAHRLASVVLLASVPASGANVSAERRELLVGALDDKAIRAELINRNTGGALEESRLRTLLDISLSSTLPQVMRQYLPSWSDDDFSSLMKGVDVSTTVMVGEHDPGITVDLMEKTVMRWLPAATLNELKGVGHYPMFESPSAFVKLLEQCFEEAPGTAQLFNPGY